MTIKFDPQLQKIIEFARAELKVGKISKQQFMKIILELIKIQQGRQ